MTQLNEKLKNLSSDTVRFDEDKQAFTIVHPDGSVKTIPLKNAVSEDLLQALEGPIDDPKQQLIDKYTKRLMTVISNVDKPYILVDDTSKAINNIIKTVIDYYTLEEANVILLENIDFVLNELISIVIDLFDPKDRLDTLFSISSTQRLHKPFGYKYKDAFGDKPHPDLFNELVSMLWSELIKTEYYACDIKKLEYCLNTIAEHAKQTTGRAIPYHIKTSNGHLSFDDELVVQAINGPHVLYRGATFTDTNLTSRPGARLDPQNLLYNVLLPFHNFVYAEPEPIPGDKQVLVTFAKCLTREGHPLNTHQRYVFEEIMNRPSSALKPKQPRLGLSAGRRFLH